MAGHTVDVETPSPGHTLGEDSAQNGSQGTGHCPDHTDDTEICSPRSVTVSQPSDSSSFQSWRVEGPTGC